jgi:DNA segregation ATPase FtsK/SpoIIIE-like protein
MVFNVLTHIEAPDIHATPDFVLSEYLSDVARIHHETAQVTDSVYDATVAEVRRLQIASPAFLRRQLKLDYAQASALIVRMEAAGVIRRTTYRSRDSRRGWRYEVCE